MLFHLSAPNKMKNLNLVAKEIYNKKLKAAKDKGLFSFLICWINLNLFNKVKVKIDPPKVNLYGFSNKTVGEYIKEGFDEYQNASEEKRQKMIEDLKKRRSSVPKSYCSKTGEELLEEARQENFKSI